MDIEIAPGKRARQAYSFDDIAIVPSRRTRDPEDVSTTWQIDAYKFDLPMLAAPMDSVVSPETAIEIGRLGGLAYLTLKVCGLVMTIHVFRWARLHQCQISMQPDACKKFIARQFAQSSLKSVFK
jgi:IMP dehydrogenase/GMP reductase